MAPKLAAAPKIWTGQPRVGDGIPKNGEWACGLYRIRRIYLPQRKIREREAVNRLPQRAVRQKTRSKQDSGAWQLGDGVI